MGLRPASSKAPKPDHTIGIRELDSFVAYLADTKQTNTLQRFANYSHVTIVMQSSVELGVRVSLLNALRDGRTNDAIRLLEMQMTSDVVSFAASYRKLPESTREKVGLNAIRGARDYCRTYPVTMVSPTGQELVEQAFRLLDEKPTH